MKFEYILYQYVKLTRTNFPVEEILDSFYDLLKIFGWSNEEFDKELLNRIDKEWIKIHKESILKQPCLSN